MGAGADLLSESESIVSSRVRLTDELLARALLALRLVGLAVAFFVVFVGLDEALHRPQVAYAAVVAMCGWTVWLAYAARVSPAHVFHPAALAIEMMVAALVVAADGWAVHPVLTWQIPLIGGVWVLAGPAAVGVSRGPILGAAAGAALGLARLGSSLSPDELVYGVSYTFAGQVDLPRLVPSVVLLAVYVSIGAGVGYLAVRLRNAESQLASVQARQDVFRELHDGVIQTLALIGAKAADPIHARLAREAERDLRSFLHVPTGPVTARQLADQLRALGAEWAQRTDLDPQFVLAPDLPAIGAAAVDAAAGVVGEALANIGKHADATRVVIYAAPEEREIDGSVRSGVTVSVTDDGRGFDPGSVSGEGRGLRFSIEERAQRVGGSSVVRSRPGEGTEVSLWIPCGS